MNIKVEVVEQSITDLALLVYEDRLEILVPNKVTVHEVIFLVTSLLNQESNQILKVKNSERFVTIGCDPIDVSKINEVVLKVEPHANFVSAFGDDELIDMFISKFSFESKLGETK
jgi:hypothetical protein